MENTVLFYCCCIHRSEWGDEPRISRAHLDASQLSVIVTDMGRANGLTIDFKDTRLYWTDIDNFRIESSDLEGLRREVRGAPCIQSLVGYFDIFVFVISCLFSVFLSVPLNVIPSCFSPFAFRLLFATYLSHMVLPCMKIMCIGLTGTQAQ